MLVAHLMNGVEIGGRERVVLELAEGGVEGGGRAHLILFDRPFRSTELDLDPGETPWEFLKRRPGLDLRYPWRLARRLRALGAGMVHAHNDTAIFYGCLAARLAGIPSLATYHTLPPPPRRGGRWLTRFAAGLASRTTVVSEELGQRLVSTGWCREEPLTIWNGVDRTRFQPEGEGRDRWRRELGVAGDEVLVGHIGRFDPIKRQADLIEAFRLLEDPPARLVFLGQGPTRGALPLNDGDERVSVVDSTMDVAGFLRAIDIFVLCSEHECAPRVLLEAMASARGCLVTRVGGMPAMLELDGAAPAGRGVTPGDVPALAAALSELISAPELRLALGERARERTRSFTAEACWQAYHEVYESLTRNGRGSRDPS